MTHTLIRSVTFAAAHRLWDVGRSAEENEKMYGKCSRIHGHNFKLVAYFKGTIFQNGMVCNIGEIDKLLQKQIHDRLDHTYLNEHIAPFNDSDNPVVPTCENILACMWNWIVDEWRSDSGDYSTGFARLHKLVLHETAKNVFEFTKRDNV